VDRHIAKRSSRRAFWPPLSGKALYGKLGQATHRESLQVKLFVRLLAMLVVVPATYYFIYWVPFSLFPFFEARWIPGIISLLCAVGVGWYVWNKLGSAPGVLDISFASPIEDRLSTAEGWSQFTPQGPGQDQDQQSRSQRE
jgi:hypothetical protein